MHNLHVQCITLFQCTCTCTCIANNTVLAHTVYNTHVIMHNTAPLRLDGELLC